MLNSDKQIARQLAIGLMSALDTLNQSSSVTKDTQTTVAGNANAHETSDSMTEIASKITQIVGNASGNIKSVASEFETMDKTIRDGMGLLPPSLKA